MDDTMKKILDKKQDLASKYQEQAALLVALDRQKSDAIAHLNGERETLRNREVSVVPTEKLEVMSDDAAKKIAEALKESGAPADQIKSAEEGFVYTQTKPEITDDTIKTIIENTNIMKNLDEKKVEQSTVTSENQVKENKTQIEEGTNDINNAIINLYQVHETINRFIDEKRQYEDTPSSKNNDDIIRNSQQIRTSLDFINKSITNYSGLVENSIDFTKEGGVKL